QALACPRGLLSASAPPALLPPWSLLPGWNGFVDRWRVELLHISPAAHPRWAGRPISVPHWTPRPRPLLRPRDSCCSPWPAPFGRWSAVVLRLIVEIIIRLCVKRAVPLIATILAETSRPHAAQADHLHFRHLGGNLFTLLAVKADYSTPFLTAVYVMILTLVVKCTLAVGVWLLACRRSLPSLSSRTRILSQFGRNSLGLCRPW
ncbi:unnamed protein product, partial [Prorocentrum cordatum]